MLIDSHAHISDTKFNEDRQVIIDKAFNSGLKYIIEVGCEPQFWDKVLELSEQEKIYSMFGLHPQDADKFNDKLLSKLKTLLSSKKCVGVGEIGLDYHFEGHLKELQKEIFIKQINLALEINKPICIHCRDAYDDMIEIFKTFKQLPKGVIHCFSGSFEQAKEVLNMGFFIGIDGPCTYPKSSKLIKVIENISLDKLLIETDCPYLAPQKYRGTRNEPSYVVEVAKKISEIKQIPFEEVCKAITKNTIELYKLED